MDEGEVEERKLERKRRVFGTKKARNRLRVKRRRMRGKG